MADFNINNVSLNQQQYIETIYFLSHQGEHKHAHAKEIAENLNVKMPSVTEALKNLQSMGLVNYKVRQAVTLTEAGTNIGRELAKSHKVFSDFFYDVLGLEKERAESIACKIEHVIERDVRDVFSEFIDFLKEGSFKEEMNVIEEFGKKINRKNG